MPVGFGFARLARRWVNSRIRDEFGHRRKFSEVAANLGEADGGKGFSDPRNCLKFGVKVVQKTSELGVENCD